MKCIKCNKLIKENTDGDLRYCQGHDIIESKKNNVKCPECGEEIEYLDWREIPGEGRCGTIDANGNVDEYQSIGDTRINYYCPECEAWIEKVITDADAKDFLNRKE